MDAVLFLILVILVYIGIPLGLGILLYFIPKKLGYPRTGTYLVIAYVLIVFAIVLLITFEDRLFTKNSARELVEEQGFTLKDDFNLVNNESVFAIGDYYHTFTLEISNRDKEELISKIKSSDNYKVGLNSIDTLMYLKAPDRYFGKKVIQNYETQYSYVREYFEPSGREGYAPTFRRISISKTNNQLTFEDIDE